MDPPPNIWEFDRYSKTKQKETSTEFAVLPPLNDFDNQVCPLLTCSGLSLRQHPLTSTPTMGIRPTTAPTIPLPTWKDPLSKVEYLHMRPFESEFFGKEKPLFLIGGQRPDRTGHFMEVSDVYSKDHAKQDLEQLKASPNRATEWTKKNMRGRTKSYHTLRLDRVTELDSQSKLYSSCSSKLNAEEKAKEEDLHENIRKIMTARRKYKREACGLHIKSKLKQAANRKHCETLRQHRVQEVQDHIDQHNDHVLAYRIVFDKFDEDGSGSMDKEELKAALYHMGLDVPEDEAGSMLQRFDTDDNGSLDFEEFAKLAKVAQSNPNSKSIFLSKEVLARNTK